jgi:hypothetical protein
LEHETKKQFLSSKPFLTALRVQPNKSCLSAKKFNEIRLMNKDDKARWVWCKKDPFAQKANKKQKSL